MCVCIICAFMCACVSYYGMCRFMFMHVCMLCSEMKNHAYIKLFIIHTLILWFILDLKRWHACAYNVLSLHVEDSSMFSGVTLALIEEILVLCNI